MTKQGIYFLKKTQKLANWWNFSPKVFPGFDARDDTMRCDACDDVTRCDSCDDAVIFDARDDVLICDARDDV